MKNFELFLNLGIDHLQLNPTATVILSEKPNQIISFTFPRSLHSITIQYTEIIFLPYANANEKRKLMGTFFLEEQPFQLFKLSEESTRGNVSSGFSKTEPVLVDALPCTALISEIQKSNDQLKLFQSNPDGFHCTLEDGVSREAYIGYRITYWFNLKSLIATCKISEDVDTST